MNLFPSTLIYLAPSTIPNAHRGVFAASDINKGSVIETVPVIVISPTDALILQQTIMRHYYFLWGDDLKQVAIALGFGSLYNHSYEPNATYKKNFENENIDFIALNDIKKDEEITVNYNFGNPDNKKTLWISDIPPAETT